MRPRSPPAERSDRLTDMSDNITNRDALYLFVCHLEWRARRNLAATKSSLQRLTIRTTTFVVLQNLSCIEAHPGLSELRMVSKSGEGAAVSKSHTSGTPFAVLWKGAQWQHRH